MVSNPALQLRNVSKRFRQGESVVNALRSVSLSVGSGEFVAFMGASGSGKSTLLHVAAGLTSTDEGNVAVDGIDLSTMSDRNLTRFRRRRIGMIFQSFNLIPALTAEENITLPLLTDKGSETVRQRLPQLLDRLQIGSRRNHRPDALSGGEQQRVAIARALISDPALVLADEPTGSLDSVNGQIICRLLRELSDEQQRTIVMITHEPSVAVWAHRVVVMKDGQAMNEFDTRECSDPQSLAVRYLEIVRTATEQG